METSRQSTIVINYVAKHSYPYVFHLVKGLAKNNCRVLAVVSKTMPEIKDWECISGVDCYKVDGYSSWKNFIPNLLKYFIFEAPKLRKMVYNNKYAVLSPLFTYWTWFVNHSLKPYKTIYVLHDPKPHNSRYIIHNCFNKLLGKKADKVVLLNKSSIEYVKKHYKRKDEDLVVIPEGSNIQINNSKIIKLVDYDSYRLNFLFQGRIEPYKGINIMLKAYKIVFDEYKDISLTIAGSGNIIPYEDDLKELPNCNIINRWLNIEEVFGLFNEKNVICVLPYISATNSGVISVAMSCKTPVIASACGGIPEQIKDGVTGFLVEPSDEYQLASKMKYVIEHQEELVLIRSNAYEHIKSLDWTNICQEFLKLL